MTKVFYSRKEILWQRTNGASRIITKVPVKIHLDTPTAINLETLLKTPMQRYQMIHLDVADQEENKIQYIKTTYKKDIGITNILLSFMSQHIF